MSISEDFQAFLSERGQELASTKTAQQTAYERQQRLAAECGEILAGLFEQLDENSEQEPSPVDDPAENDFNKFFNL